MIGKIIMDDLSRMSFYHFNYGSNNEDELKKFLCPHIILRGKRKGERCNNICINGSRCELHRIKQKKK